jgi:surfeit locus 1 family protein
MTTTVAVTRRRFAPRLPFTLLAVIACLLFVRLGFWQWHKGEDRQLAWQRFTHGTDTLVALGARAADDVPLFQRVRVTGSLDGAHQFLLDNRSYRGTPGYEVLTPLKRDGARTLLIDRGWVPFSGSRRTLPDVALPASAQAAADFTGRVAQLPAAGLASGRAPPEQGSRWPKLTSFPAPPDLEAALGVPLEPRIVLLDAAAPYGYARDWQPPGMPPLRHFSYAIQWWCFAGLTAVTWLVMSTRRSA